MSVPARVRERIAAAVEELRDEGVVCWLEEYPAAGKLTLEVWYEAEGAKKAPRDAPGRAGKGV